MKMLKKISKTNYFNANKFLNFHNILGLYSNNKIKNDIASILSSYKTYIFNKKNIKKLDYTKEDLDFKINLLKLNFHFSEKNGRCKLIKISNCGSYELEIDFFTKPCLENVEKSYSSIMKGLSIPSINITTYITITKLNKIKNNNEVKSHGISLFFQGMINKNELNIDYYMLFNDKKDSIAHTNRYINGEVNRDYTSKDFTIIDMVIQERFYCFIEEIGFNKDIIDIIIKLSNFYDNNLKIIWFDKIQNYLM